MPPPSAQPLRIAIMTSVPFFHLSLRAGRGRHPSVSEGCRVRGRFRESECLESGPPPPPPPPPGGGGGTPPPLPQNPVPPQTLSRGAGSPSASSAPPPPPG